MRSMQSPSPVGAEPPAAMPLLAQGDARWAQRQPADQSFGSGDAALERAFAEAAAAHPGRVGVRIGYDETVAHRVIAGADLILVPSRFEPCGLTQLYGMRYGTLDEQVAPILFLASDESSYITGTVLPVAGGDLG